MFVRKFYNTESAVEMVRRIAKIDEEIPDPGKKPRK
jgi:hypothetical protein